MKQLLALLMLLVTVGYNRSPEKTHLVNTPSGLDLREPVWQDRSRRPAARPSGRIPTGFDDGEFLVDTSIISVPAPEFQTEAAVAFDGENYLVVWSDDRGGISSDIYGMRVTPAGKLLDPTAIVIAAAETDQLSPALAFDGTNYLVVWGEETSMDLDIRGARVTPAGVVLDPAGIGISGGWYEQLTPAVAFDGINYLVVWEDWRTSHNGYIAGARVTPAGVVLDPGGIVISSADGNQWSPALAFDGENCLAVWQDSRGGDHSDIYGARVTSEGVVLDTEGIAISIVAQAQSPALAFDSVSYLVVWEDYRNDPDTSDIYGARVTPAGVVLDTAGIPISTAVGDQRYPALAFDGSNYLAVWEVVSPNPDTSDIHGARVTPAGVVLDTAGLMISTVAGWQEPPAVASDGGNYLAVWQDARGGQDSDIYGARVTPSGVVLDTAGITISTAADRQLSPAVAFDRENYLVVWEEGLISDRDVCCARVTPAGAVLDPAGLSVSSAVGCQELPAVAFDGENYLAVWQDTRSGVSTDIYGARVTQAGAILDPAGLPITTAAAGQSSPAVAFDGENYLVLWEDFRNNPDTSDIFGARVSPAGVVLDTAGIAISTAARVQQHPAVAFDGERYLAVWEDRRRGTDIFGARVTPAGVVLDTAGIAVSTAARWQWSPAVAFDSANFFVVWEDGHSTDRDIYAARVTPEGTVLDLTGLPITTPPGWQTSPMIAFDGTDYFIAWEDDRGDDVDISGARVTPAGVVLDTLRVVGQEGAQVELAITRGSGSRLFLVYQGWAGTVGGKRYDTDRIWGKLNPGAVINEDQEPHASGSMLGATIVRGILRFLPTAGSSQQTAELLDITGRRVMDLVPGPNDIRNVSPGVYFVRKPETEDGRPRTAVRKIVIQR
jgi:hypothetical protein